ncbi:MAG: polysaccharide deacetylase family protein [Flavobacteriaceae bacterium]
MKPGRPLAAFVLAASMLAGHHALAACPQGALGTSRVMEVDVSRTPGIGTFQFKTPVLEPGEVILTFDDGPVPSTTPKILDALAQQCVRASFFMIGKRAAAHPELVRRMVEEGHTVASHTFSHAELKALPEAEAEREVVEGYRAVEEAAFGETDGDRARFFRFPGFKSTPQLLAFARAHHIAVVSADMSAQDWRGGPPEETMQRLEALLDKKGRGIIVLHDNQQNTAALLPALLDELKARGLRVVHMEPK